MPEFAIRKWAKGDVLPADAAQWVYNAAMWYAERDGEYAGIAAARPVAEGEYELLYIETNPSARRIGVATALLMTLLDEYRGVWFLEVRESNIAARRLYERLGFEFRGRRTRYYSNPDEDALVLAREA